MNENLKKMKIFGWVNFGISLLLLFTSFRVIINLAKHNFWPSVLTGLTFLTVIFAFIIIYLGVIILLKKTITIKYGTIICWAAIGFFGILTLISLFSIVNPDFIAGILGIPASVYNKFPAATHIIALIIRIGIGAYFYFLLNFFEDNSDIFG